MQIYQLKLVLRGISPMVWRRLLVHADTSIAALHAIFQTAMGWEDCHLHRFRIHGKDFGITYQGGMSFADDPHQVRLSQFRLRPSERFLYEYDFADRWLLDVRLEATLPAESQRFYPVCTAGKQACPLEDCGGVEDYLLQRRALISAETEDLQVLAEHAERLLDGRPLGLVEGSEEYAALALAALRTEARERFALGSFDRHRVNLRLQRLQACTEGKYAVPDPSGVH